MVANRKNGSNVQVISLNATDHRMLFHMDNLKNILENSVVADKRVALISVAGSYRTGKSFILNFFLRYLYWAENGKRGDWLSNDQLLEGFEWSAGDESVTNGILIWNKPFVLRDKMGKEFVVLLMDTQGAFDGTANMNHCATFFAFSSLVSSLQIYNLMNQLDDSNLQNLQLFSEYGRTAKSAEHNIDHEKVFQNLTFLIRDRPNAPYGFQGGETYLKTKLEIKPNQDHQHVKLHKYVKESSQNMNCFLLSHPGKHVTSNTFTGDLKKVDEDFLEQVQVLVEETLGNSEIVKNMNGQELTCRELFVFIEKYANVFENGEMPEMLTVYEATVKATREIALTSSVAIYEKIMVYSIKEYKTEKELMAIHEHAKEKASLNYNERARFGDSDFETHLNELAQVINKLYKDFCSLNDENKYKALKEACIAAVPVVAAGLMTAATILAKR